MVEGTTEVKWHASDIACENLPVPMSKFCQPLYPTRCPPHHRTRTSYHTYLWTAAAQCTGSLVILSRSLKVHGTSELLRFFSELSTIPVPGNAVHSCNVEPFRFHRGCDELTRFVRQFELMRETCCTILSCGLCVCVCVCVCDCVGDEKNCSGLYH